eukprot:535365-Amphidinium_carterae.1
MTAQEDEDEAAPKTFRLPDAEGPLHVMMSIGYNPLEDSMAEEVGEKTVTVDVKHILNLPRESEEFHEWLKAFKQEYDAFVDKGVFEEYLEQDAKAQGIQQRNVLPMKLVTVEKPQP